MLLLESLGSFFEFGASVSEPRIEHGDPLTVLIRKGERNEKPDFTKGDRDDGSLLHDQVVSTEFVDHPQEVASDESPESPVNSLPVRDWYAIADEAAEAIVNEYFKREESRESMWRSSRSIMFQPTNDKVVMTSEPIFSDIRFKYRSRVLGIGINIGSCFIGVPIVGVPVEKRSTAITLFVCG